MISLYFHIPFCTKKCPYCHFYVIPNRLPYHKILSDSLALEWEQKWPLLQGKRVTSIYFGGGTPTLFNGIETLLKKIPREPDCEITVEANPEESTFSLFSHLRTIGVNRLSLGVQSLDDRSLQTLERTHSAAKARHAIFNAQKALFQNVSIDLMYDLPGQTEASWRYTLDQLPDLPIQHVSLYNLTIEPYTAFHKRHVQIPEGNLSVKLLSAALEKLETIGLKRYEISAFAIPGYASRHNLGYWTARPFLGYGPSAFSYWEGDRFRNIAHIHRYATFLKKGVTPVDFREHLSFPAHIKELLALRLRLKEGVDVNTFAIPLETNSAIEKCKRLGFLKQKGSHLQLTERGMLFYDTVAVEII